MAKDKPNFLEEIRETLAKGGADILGAVTGALDNFSLTSEKLTGLVNKYFGSEPETLTAYRDANQPSSSNEPTETVMQTTRTTVQAPAIEAPAQVDFSTLTGRSSVALAYEDLGPKTAIFAKVDSITPNSVASASPAQVTNKSTGSAPSLV